MMHRDLFIYNVKSSRLHLRSVAWFGLTACFVLLLGCSSEPLPIEILERKRLKSIPESSGIIYEDERYYVVGDKLNTLFLLNGQWDLEAQFDLVPTDTERNASKDLKTDLESIAIHKDSLFIFSSGSKKKGSNWIFIHSIKDGKTLAYDLTLFLNEMRQMSRNKKINLEGAAIHDEFLFLADRYSNTLYVFELRNFLQFVQQKTQKIHPVFQRKFNFPKIDGTQALLSGLEISPKGDFLYFTASVEQDKKGEKTGILGSFIGKIALKNSIPSGSVEIHPLPETHGIMKVESIDLINVREAVLVVDNDAKSSHILRCRIDF